MSSSVTPFRRLAGQSRAVAVTLLAAAWLTGGVSGAGQEASVPAEAGMAAFGRLVPLGFVSRDVRIPSFDAEGAVASILTAETLIRIDDERLQAGRCAVEIVGERPEEDVRVELNSAIYHMIDRTLRSGERSRVSRSDFQMEGDSMVFDSETSIGRMKGRVRTIIFDTTALSGTSDETAASGN